jgi:hypothetical protein
MLSRRDSLAALAAAIAFVEDAAPAMFRSPGEPFSWDWLKTLALRTAQQP